MEGFGASPVLHIGKDVLRALEGVQVLLEYWDVLWLAGGAAGLVVHDGHSSGKYWLAVLSLGIDLRPQMLVGMHRDVLHKAGAVVNRGKVMATAKVGIAVGVYNREQGVYLGFAGILGSLDQALVIAPLDFVHANF